MTAKLEEELAVFHPLDGVLERHPSAEVPDDHLAPAVFLFGDDTLELDVLDRVIFHVDGELLVHRVGRDALGDGP